MIGVVAFTVGLGIGLWIGWRLAIPGARRLVEQGRIVRGPNA